MLSIAVGIAIAMVGLAMLLNLWRLMRGPWLVDRVLALDTLAINTIALVMLFGISIRSAVYFDAALIVAMMGFVGTAAFCKYILSGDVIE